MAVALPATVNLFCPPRLNISVVVSVFKFQQFFIIFQEKIHSHVHYDMLVSLLLK